MKSVADLRPGDIVVFERTDDRSDVERAFLMMMLHPVDSNEAPLGQHVKNCCSFAMTVLSTPRECRSCMYEVKLFVPGHGVMYVTVSSAGVRNGACHLKLVEVGER